MRRLHRSEALPTGLLGQAVITSRLPYLISGCCLAGVSPEAAKPLSVPVAGRTERKAPPKWRSEAEFTNCQAGASGHQRAAGIRATPQAFSLLL